MKNKLLIVFSVILIFSIISNVLAVNTAYTQSAPYTDTFTPDNRNSLTLANIESTLNFKSCTVDANWQSKNCQYLYWCYAILPSTSTQITDALQKECQDVSAASSASLTVNNFVPPVGVLYYVTTFMTLVNYTYSTTTQTWTSTTIIPNTYIKASSIRSICSNGQMLWFDAVAGQYTCKVAQHICFDTSQTGLCTNAYDIYNLTGTGTQSSLCADRNKDGICDLVSSLGCVDTCSKYNTAGACIQSGANGVCDSDDQAAVYSCVEGSVHSKVCSSIDTALCNTIYTPVCVSVTSGTIVGGQTYPNSCFASSKGYSACTAGPNTNCYVNGACSPPITQCYVSNDCPTINACLGSFPITKQCLANQCSYSGTCGNLACNQDSDCNGIVSPCVGVSAKCTLNVCSVQGQCITKPVAQSLNIWDSIANVWSNFWNFIKGLFGG
jgi:hypothetical protein